MKTILFTLSLLSFMIAAHISAGQSDSVDNFRALVLTTSFDLPIVRFNFIENEGALNNEQGRVEFFNSIGAGVGFKFGRIKRYRNESDSEIVTEFSNIIGLSSGVLFSSSETAEGRQNIFAPTLGISVLDLKFGVGYELGDREEGISPWFMTIAYGIPISKLTKKGGLILKNYQKTGSTKAAFF